MGGFEEGEDEEEGEDGLRWGEGEEFKSHGWCGWFFVVSEWSFAFRELGLNECSRVLRTSASLYTDTECLFLELRWRLRPCEPREYHHRGKKKKKKVVGNSHQI